MIKKIRLQKHFICAKEIQGLRNKTRSKLVLRVLDSVRSLLDDHYHDIISDSEFIKWGHIYYNPNGIKISRKKDYAKSL